MRAVPPPSSTSGSDLAYLDRLEKALGLLDRRIKIADLAVYTGRSQKGARAPREVQARLLSQPRMLDWIAEARGRAGSLVVERRLELLRRLAVDRTLEQSPDLVRRRARLQRAFSAASHRPKRSGVSTATLLQTLRESPDREARRRAFRAIFAPDRRLEAATLELIRARIQRCRDLGQGSFVSAHLAMEGLTLGQWEDLCERLRPIVRARLAGRRERFHRLTREGGWYPWDERYLARLESFAIDASLPADTAFRTVRRGTKGWGFPERAYRFTTQSTAIPFGGMVSAVKAPDDVRLIFTPRPGWAPHRLLFHEMGHAIQACLTSGESFLLRNDFMPSFGGELEGVGTLFMRIPSALGWLQTFPRLTPEQVKDLQSRAQEFFWSDLALTLVHAETEVQTYLHPSRDPGETRYRLQREIGGYDSYDPTMWADMITVDTPLYFRSYVLGSIFSTQVLRAGLDAVGGEVWPNSKLGPWLSENWFAPGAAHDWVPRVSAITGHALGVQDLTWD